MMQNSVEAAPLSLKMSLGKMAMAGLTRSLSGARASVDFDAIDALAALRDAPACWSRMNLKMTLGIATLAVLSVIYLAPLVSRMLPGGPGDDAPRQYNFQHEP